MKLLVVDTARDSLFMALVEGGLQDGGTRILARRRSSGRAGKRQDERVFPALRGLLSRAGWTLRDLEAVGVVNGPGRFTGIRIGMTFAAMLSRTLPCRAFGLSRFEVLARALPIGLQGKVCVALPASQPPQEEFYFQVFSSGPKGWRSEGEARWARASDLGAAVGPVRWFQGPAAGRAAEVCGLPADSVLPGGQEEAAALAACAAEAAERGTDSPLRPLYLKPWRGQKPANHDKA